LASKTYSNRIFTVLVCKPPLSLCCFNEATAKLALTFGVFNCLLYGVYRVGFKTLNVTVTWWFKSHCEL